MELNQSTFVTAFLNGTPPGADREDCKLIQRYAKAEGIALTRWQAYEVWKEYSGQRCAGWLMGISTPTVLEALQEFIDRRFN